MSNKMALGKKIVKKFSMGQQEQRRKVASSMKSVQSIVQSVNDWAGN
jgi:hypothetical protein